MKNACPSLRIAPLSALVALLLLYGLPAAGDDATLAALDLADSTEVEPVEEKNLTAMAEVAASFNEYGKSMQRVSLDMRWDTPLMENLSQDWRLVLANRIDSRFTRGMRENRNVNSLKEAYLTYRLTPQSLFDMGRVNTRYGVAFGYNPTDFLGRGTIRSVTSADPDLLRSNRLGNGMIRWQQLWDKAALTTIFSPKLSGHTSDRSGSLDWGASNPRDRVLLVGSYQFSENLNPQLLLLHEQGRSPQVGVNFSRVLSRYTLLYAEWAGGRQPYNWQNSLPRDRQHIAWRNRLATGMTWSGDNGLTLRVEGQYDGASDSKRARATLAGVPAYVLEREKASYGGSDQQAADWLRPRHALLLQGYWKDIVDRYDVNAIWLRDLQQNRNLGFTEVRRRFRTADVALQWQRVYQADQVDIKQVDNIQPEQRWQLSFSYYF